jgi:hypothetical protein
MERARKRRPVDSSLHPRRTWRQAITDAVDQLEAGEAIPARKAYLKRQEADEGSQIVEL